MGGTVLLYANVPSVTELCCLVAQIDLSEIQDSTAKSHFHWKTLKCRLLIDTMRDAIIASPIFETIGSIHVIVGVEFFKTRLLQKTFRETNMTWSTPRPVTPDVYANCLRYSILFALAPRWNRAGQFLINDKDFLTVTESSTAMRFVLNLEPGNDKNIRARLTLEPIKVKLCDLTLEGLGLPDGVIADFMADPDGSIDLASFGDPRVTVLPSLKRGKLMAVLKKIPASSPFESYRELRRHWKNMYGYSLPETDDGLIYHDVHFPVPTAHSFLYPHICVRSRISESPYFGDQDLLVQSFLLSIRETLPMICGRSLKFIAAGQRNVTKDLSVEVAASGCSENANGSVSKDEPKSYGAMANVAKVHGYSTPCFTPKLERLGDNSYGSMSPTPSLRGALRNDETRTEKLRGILSTIARFREAAPSARLSRIKGVPMEAQNQCPNIGKNCTRVSMEIESEGQVFMPRSNLTDTRSRSEKPPILANTLNEMKNQTKIESSEIVSKYFDSSEKPYTRIDRTVSQSSEKTTLREKLLKNTMM